MASLLFGRQTNSPASKPSSNGVELRELVGKEPRFSDPTFLLRSIPRCLGSLRAQEPGLAHIVAGFLTARWCITQNTRRCETWAKSAMTKRLHVVVQRVAMLFVLFVRHPHHKVFGPGPVATCPETTFLDFCSSRFVVCTYIDGQAGVRISMYEGAGCDPVLLGVLPGYLPNRRELPKIADFRSISVEVRGAVLA